MARDDSTAATEYRVGDALEELRTLPDDTAAVVHLDDAWARPHRNGCFGVEYPTHAPDSEGGTWDILDETRRVLKSGGWLIADADDWLLPRLVDYLREEWGDVAASYQGGGYRRVGGVTLLSSDGSPDRSTPGQYGATGGYPVVFAHAGDTDRRWTASSRQLAYRPRERYGWGSVKPISPYQTWLEAITESGEPVVIPCAGTAPAAIAAERLGRDWLAIDCEPEAREAFERRRAAVLTADSQQSLTEVARS